MMKGFGIMILRGEIETAPRMVLNRKDDGSQFYLDQHVIKQQQFVKKLQIETRIC